MSEKEPIVFYKTKEAYGFFANFARYPIALDDKLWPTTEHYYQAQKHTDQDIQEQIRKLPKPSGAAKLGRSKDLTIRPDWEVIKNDVMRKALHAKFTQHEELKQALLETGDRVIVEHSLHDGYWGDGGDGSGQNILGQMLTELRSQLKKD